MPKRKISPILVGVAGEYCVAAELSNLGYIASITLRNTKGIDIIATNERGKKTVNIQVNPGSDSTGAADEWYRMKVFIASFEVLSYDEGGYSCP